ncbi:uncharacterized protein LOC117922727 [Vitis riparia]|uniref:uncharacterized protein LOC117922727 n=1 Tax=Vitis riparia TaxID=96939 RepID=UPI00155A376A|nr:uncharacterized protein LOC117922727 [Vitis riparia]
MDCQADPLRQPKRSFGTRVKCEECKLEGYIYLVPGHGHHLEQNHCTDVPLMLFECDGIVPVQYYFESGWSAITTSGRRINNIDLICQGYEDEIDGERIAIIVEAKFLPYSGR